MNIQILQGSAATDMMADFILLSSAVYLKM